MYNVSLSRRTSITLCISALALWAPNLRADGPRPSTTLVRPPWKHNLGFNTLRQFHLTAYGDEDFVLSDPRGIAAVKLRAKDAEGVADDDEVTVLGVNAGRGEIIYNPSLVRLARFDGTMMPAPPLRDPVGVAVDAAGLVAVGDRGNDRVVLLRFDRETRLRFVKAITLESSGRRLSRPSGVALADGRVYVADSGNDRVVVIDTAGVVLREFDGLERPFDVDVIVGPVANYYDEAFVAVTDRGGDRLSRIDLAGQRRLEVNSAETTGGAGGFGYLAIDYFGSILVGDTTTGCVYKLDRALELLDRFECDGDEFDELGQPRGIAIHRRLGQVFVAEREGVGYYWVGTDITGLRARVTRSADPIEIEVRFVLTERSDVTVTLVPEGDPGVEDLQSGPISLDLARGVRMPAGRQRLVYRVDSPELACDVAVCKYQIEVRASATYASRNHLDAVRRSSLQVPPR